MARKSNRSMPVVESGLLYTDDINTTGLRIGGPEWFGWCEDNRSFYYRYGDSGFTVRRENQHRSRYWFAYKRVGGRLVKKYVGELPTREKLEDIGKIYAGLSGSQK